MTTISIADFNLSPEIIVGHDEHRQLLALALAGIGHTADDSDWLLYELERARIVPDATVPANVARIGSTVRFRAGDSLERTAELVLPRDADIAAGRVSVLTPIGTALLGLRAGQSITWLTRDLRKQLLTVTHVAPPAIDNGGPLAS